MTNSSLTLGAFCTNFKEPEFEKRLGLHPDDLSNIPSDARKQVFLESGYGKPWHLSDDALKQTGIGGVMPRHQLLQQADVLLIPKITQQDMNDAPANKIFWGWPHFVQNADITQTAIDKGLSSITFEGSFDWNGVEKGQHSYYANNEMAGYCGAMHALQLRGITGQYGGWAEKTVVVISHGSVSQGAIKCLQGQGFNNITVFTNRPPEAVDQKFPGVRYAQFNVQDDGTIVTNTAKDSGNNQAVVPFVETLKDAAIVVNGTLQDPDHPKMFVRDEDVPKLPKGQLVIDISCDNAMGFPFAVPTSFAEPMIETNGGVYYYAVDHTPTLCWDSATREISSVNTPLIPEVLQGKNQWLANPTLRNAFEMDNGRVRNPAILSFQNRDAAHPHPIKSRVASNDSEANRDMRVA